MSNSPKVNDALRRIAATGWHGMTGREYAVDAGVSHGSSTGLLSRLHAMGQTARLVEQRDKGSIYVYPPFVGGRATIAPKRPVPEGMPVDGAPTQSAMPPIDVPPGEDAYPLLRRMVASQRMDREALRKKAGHERTRLQREIDALRVEVDTARDACKAASDAAWQAGYDEGRARGMEGSDAYGEGRALGRMEGEDALRKHLGLVGTELVKAIQHQQPIRGHFAGCYTIHPECAARALMRGAGIVRPRHGMDVAAG